MNHNLKIEQVYLDNLLSGKKKCEVRINDRDYQVGDTLTFTNYDRNFMPEGSYPALCIFIVTHIHSVLGLDRSYVVLSVEPEG